MMAAWPAWAAIAVAAAEGFLAFLLVDDFLTGIIDGVISCLRMDVCMYGFFGFSFQFFI